MAEDVPEQTEIIQQDVWKNAMQAWHQVQSFYDKGTNASEI